MFYTANSDSNDGDINGNSDSDNYNTKLVL